MSYSTTPQCRTYNVQDGLSTIICDPLDHAIDSFHICFVQITAKRRLNMLPGYGDSEQVEALVMP